MLSVISQEHASYCSRTLETLYTPISIKVGGSFQAYVTRPKGSVGSCKYVLVSRLSAVGQELQIS